AVGVLSPSPLCLPCPSEGTRGKLLSGLQFGGALGSGRGGLPGAMGQAWPSGSYDSQMGGLVGLGSPGVAEGCSSVGREVKIVDFSPEWDYSPGGAKLLVCLGVPLGVRICSGAGAEAGAGAGSGARAGTEEQGEYGQPTVFFGDF
ncbi:unnamed protein product, partial [Discosporangium mesarthrocarpum]